MRSLLAVSGQMRHAVPGEELLRELTVGVRHQGIAGLVFLPLEARPLRALKRVHHQMTIF
jgi:hypothetical protein